MLWIISVSGGVGIRKNRSSDRLCLSGREQGDRGDKVGANCERYGNYVRAVIILVKIVTTVNACICGANWRLSCCGIGGAFLSAGPLVKIDKSVSFFDYW